MLASQVARRDWTLGELRGIDMPATGDAMDVRVRLGHCFIACCRFALSTREAFLPLHVSRVARARRSAQRPIGARRVAQPPAAHWPNQGSKLGRGCCRAVPNMGATQFRLGNNAGARSRGLRCEEAPGATDGTGGGIGYRRCPDIPLSAAVASRTSSACSPARANAARNTLQVKGLPR